MLFTVSRNPINSNRNGSRVSFQVLTGPVKEFKTVNNSISRVIRVLIDKQRILFSEVWDGVDHRTNTKMRGSKYKNALRPNIYVTGFGKIRLNAANNFLQNHRVKPYG